MDRPREAHARGPRTIHVVAAASTRPLFGYCAGVEAGWAKDWERWVQADGCKLGNVVKLDGPDDAAAFGAAALDVKIYPEGQNASRGRFNAYFTRNYTDENLRHVITARVRRENPTCGPTKYLFGHGMLERIYPGFFGVEFEERRRRRTRRF